MSQISFSALSGSTQSKSPVKNPVTEFFKGIVKEAGIKLCSGDDPNVITQEQALVVRDIEKSLEKNYSDDCTERFLKGFKLLIKKDKYMRKALLPTLFKKNNDESNTKNEQESLFRLFVKVNHLQHHIIEILLDEITNTVSEDNEDPSYLRLLLSQLRYLPHIKNPETLTTKLLDIMEIAKFPSQLEILDSIPEILPDSEYKETAVQLAKMLDNEELSGAIIDCLNSLNLDSEIKAQVQDHILAKMLTEPSLKLFPIFLEFLITEHKNQDLSSILLKIRNVLDNLMASTDRNDKEKESGKIVIFDALQKLTSRKIVTESWLTVITKIKIHTDHKPIDLLILFMLHSCVKFKKRVIEATFRKRIKDGLFKCSLLEKFFEKYLPQQLLRNYFQSMTEVGSSLLRTTNDVTVAEFVNALFQHLFKHEHTDVIRRQELLDCLVLIAGSSDQKNVTAILNIFKCFLDDDITLFRQHTILLMKLLEKLDSFELKDVRIIFDILCALTCTEDSLSGLKEELHMIIRKQLISSKRCLKHRGIISAVVMAKHVATVEEELSEVQVSEESILSIAHLKGRAKEAAAILELAKTSTSGNPELLGLYYDQLASILLESERLDKNFSIWLFETITNDFQNVFVTETVCPDMGDLQFSMQYNINTEEEMDTPIAVNIAELTLKGEKSTIMILAPHFRLLRLLHYRYQNGDLSSIDALLGCGVVLPKTEQKHNLDTEQLKQVSDCVFHCINWFREVVSGFVTQKDKKLRRKVIQRIDNLIELEKLLKECLMDIPGHSLPASYFDSVNQVATHKAASSPQKEIPSRPRKKLKTRSIIDDTTAAGVGTSKKLFRKPTEEVLIRFREIDTDVVRLIKYPLNVADSTTTSSDQTTLSIDQLNYILEDFAGKLTKVTGGRDLGLSHLNVVVPLDLIADCKMILPNINRHFLTLVKLIDESETVDDEIKTGFGLILEILHAIFSWAGFQHTKHLDLLRNVLKSFRGDSGVSLNSVNRLVVDLVDRLSNHVDHCAYLTQAVSLIKIMEALYLITPGPEIRKQIAKTSGKLLSRPWHDSQKNNAANLDILIKSYLSNANTKTLCGLVGTLEAQAAQLKNKDDRLPMLESVDKKTFYIFYRNLWCSLHDRVKTEIQSLTNSEHLTLWKTTALTMQGLMTVAKAQDSNSNLTCFLKKSIAILKIFLSQGITMLEIMLKSKPDEVVEIFKTMQLNTRFLHHLCCYSKVIKNGSLIAHVPQFRLILETLVYRVKAALVANGCSAAFWMGNLKNRDLQGEDIVTQDSENTNAEENEDEEELPMSDEEEVDEEEEEHRRKSGSEVFD